jgi:hypothetical protein
MASLHWLKFGGTCLHWPKPSDKSDISLQKNTALESPKSTAAFVDDIKACNQIIKGHEYREWRHGLSRQPINQTGSVVQIVD